MMTLPLVLPLVGGIWRWRWRSGACDAVLIALLTVRAGSAPAAGRDGRAERAGALVAELARPA